MKTYCPLMHIAAPIWERAGYSQEISECTGPRCQWWHKCRQKNQCPKCGAICEQEDYAHGYECTACKGWFDKDGDFIYYDKKEEEREADKTVA